MKKILCLLMILLLSETCASALTVPSDTPIVVSLKRHKSQRTMHTKLDAVIKKDVCIDGKLVFIEDGKAEIYIKENRKARFFGKGGRLTLCDGIVYDVNGRKHHVHMKETLVGKNAPFIAKFLIFKKGQNVVIYPNQNFVLKTNNSFEI